MQWKRNLLLLQFCGAAVAPSKPEYLREYVDLVVVKLAAGSYRNLGL